ncbi:hypothetical protein [Deinococcus koreensis]|uniref:Uncharacterized protein n=1 Tax=Deinococcus koreensis TaxID=2054903 RepID=A0A2K3UV55_9DEIO|nr:hypothetical protein [Deinococcus koreensis]PNY80417.1 hypothetical protein CVO96_02665 [Deinococcus koreensis]
MSTLRGHLRLPDGPAGGPVEGAVPERAARVLVELRDVGLQDAPAPLLAQADLRDVALAGGRVEFTLSHVPDLGGRQCAIRAHVDFSGDGRISPGDLLTTRHVPVVGTQEELEVPVERV